MHDTIRAAAAPSSGENAPAHCLRNTNSSDEALTARIKTIAAAACADDLARCGCPCNAHSSWVMIINDADHGVLMLV
jgi:hypothetical protein